MAAQLSSSSLVLVRSVGMSIAIAIGLAMLVATDINPQDQHPYAALSPIGYVYG